MTSELQGALYFKKAGKHTKSKKNLFLWHTYDKMISMNVRNLVKIYVVFWGTKKITKSSLSRH